jgi:nitric oxide synthase-interacting protein
MIRHARNSTAGSVYTCPEKKRDAKASGYGSLSERFSKDSIKGFDCYSLTLQPCNRNPVVRFKFELYFWVTLNIVFLLQCGWLFV